MDSTHKTRTPTQWDELKCRININENAAKTNENPAKQTNKVYDSELGDGSVWLLEDSDNTTQNPDLQTIPQTLQQSKSNKTKLTNCDSKLSLKTSRTRLKTQQKHNRKSNKPALTIREIISNTTQQRKADGLTTGNRGLGRLFLLKKKQGKDGFVYKTNNLT